MYHPLPIHEIMEQAFSFSSALSVGQNLRLINCPVMVKWSRRPGRRHWHVKWNPLALKVRLRSNESWRNPFVMFQKLSLFWYIYIKNNILEFLAHERYLFWDKLKVLKVLTSCETKIDWSVEDDHQQQTKCSCQSLRSHLGVHLLECTKTDSMYALTEIFQW